MSALARAAELEGNIASIPTPKSIRAGFKNVPATSARADFCWSIAGGFPHRSRKERIWMALRSDA
eukprot:3501104-Pyramimonas_sp.AAC.1